MGNFSNDPQARATESIGKHYVGVRMQQAVPVLDADWNLLEDLRRREVEVLGTWFIGSGVPTGSDGFAIFAVAAANDFGIRGGLCITSGKLTENSADVAYSTQPNFGAPDVFPPVTALTTPPADKSFIAYLDVWEREVDSQKDPALVDSRIGVETAIRLKRDWVVRVARVPEDLPGLDTPPVGHVFMRLAQLNRKAANANITSDMIVDLRNTQLSILRKIEVRNSIGTVVVDNASFAQMLKDTRNNVLALSTYLTSVFNAPSTGLMSGEILGLQAIEVISHATDAGLALVNSSSVTNPGALQYMFQVYDAENNFFNVWKNVMLQLGSGTKKYATYQVFVTELGQLLNQPVAGGFTGLQSALQAGDLQSATLTQGQIALLFGAAGNANIPHGGLQILLVTTPAGILTTGQTVTFGFQVTSFTTLADTYTVSILPQAGWPRTVVNAGGIPIANNKVAIPASPSQATIFINVTVQAGSSGLQIRVTSDSNPTEIDQLSNSFTLTQGQPAPLGENKILFRLSITSGGTIDPQSGNVDITRGKQCLLSVQVINNTGTDATFALSLAKSGETPANSWTVNYDGDASVPIPNGKFVSEPMDITPGAGAVSVQLQFTASTTIAGSLTSAQLVIGCAAQ
jgi:hypothetical protein